MNRHNTRWNGEREALLRKLHKEGKNTREMAEALQVFSRPSIVAKLHRMNLKIPSQRRRVSPLKSKPTEQKREPILNAPKDNPVTLVRSVRSQERFTWNSEEASQ